MTGEVETVTVSGDDGALRLDRWFRRHYPALAHGRLEKLLRTGQIRVDGKRAKAGDRVMPGQAIRVPPIGRRRGPRRVPAAPGAAGRRGDAAGGDPAPRRRRHRAQQAAGSRGPGRDPLRAASRRAARRAALWPCRAAAARPPARQGHERRSRRRPHRRGGGVSDPRLSRQDDAQDLLGARRRPAEAARRGGSAWRSPRGTGAGANGCAPTPTTASTRSPITASSTAPASGRAGWRCCRSPGARTSCARIAPRSARRSSATANTAAPARTSPGRRMRGGCICMRANCRSRIPQGGILRVTAPLAAAYAAELGVLRLSRRCRGSVRRAGSAGMKRFYRQAAILPAEEGYGVALDGKPIKTPAKRELDRADRGLGGGDRRRMGRPGGRDPPGRDAADPARQHRDRPGERRSATWSSGRSPTTPGPISSAIARSARRS